MESARPAQIDIGQMRTLLERERRRLRAVLARESEDLQSLTQERHEALPAGRDPAEQGTLIEVEEEAAAETEEVAAELRRVDHALERIEHGTYEFCEDCGKPIPAARLRALPTATSDIGCEQARIAKHKARI